MDAEDMKRWVAAIDARRKLDHLVVDSMGHHRVGETITIPIILDPSLPPDGWYLKPNLFVEVGSE